MRFTQLALLLLVVAPASATPDADAPDRERITLCLIEYVANVADATGAFLQQPQPRLLAHDLTSSLGRLVDCLHAEVRCLETFLATQQGSTQQFLATLDVQGTLQHTHDNLVTYSAC